MRPFASHSLQSRADPARAEETHEFSCLFSDHARLKPQFSREGTGVWGSEVTESPFLAYIKGIRVEPEYRGHGIGPWALQKLLDPTDPHFGVRRGAPFALPARAWRS